MYKVLLADDERIILDGIAGIIEWDSIGTSLIGKAQNGLDAYEFIMRYKPDIVISDIKMPGMNGLELIEKVSSECPSVQFILLSGFGEFEYAKQAMKYGVKHYLVKPCNEQQIISSLKEIIAEFKQKERREKAAECLKDELEHIRSYAANQYLEGLLTGVKNQAPPLAVQDKTINLILVKTDAATQSYQTAKEAFGSGLTAYCHLGDYAILAVETQRNVEVLEKKLAVCFEGCQLTISRAGELRHAKDLFEEITDAYSESKHSALISKMVKLVRGELGNPHLSLKWAAKEMLYMNPDYLGKLFKQETGEKFSAYVTRIRVEHAMKRMKSRKDVSVSDIAEEIGFGDNPKYFSLVFKKYTGLTPSEYLKKQRGASVR
ncbi:response regulator transcription factor [Bacillus atrophaeus]|uniref:response regulator transcription factor n=1 Tax=Bacillus atrophaeus TaxID=1452 RepID=UPI000B92D727|nr:response regulator [Bacillus atrophaeus]ASS70235.1 DNA-binding response regulator [Bacillus atrophaeus]